jgi:hypothetical protein
MYQPVLSLFWCKRGAAGCPEWRIGSERPPGQSLPRDGSWSSRTASNSRGARRRWGVSARGAVHRAPSKIGVRADAENLRQTVLMPKALRGSVLFARENAGPPASFTGEKTLSKGLEIVNHRSWFWHTRAIAEARICKWDLDGQEPQAGRATRGNRAARAKAAPIYESNHHNRILRFGTKWQLLGHGFGAILALPERVAESGFIGMRSANAALARCAISARDVPSGIPRAWTRSTRA